MIVVDTSALIAIMSREPEAQACAALIRKPEPAVITAANFLETMIVASKRDYGREMAHFIETMGIEIYPVDASLAREAVTAHLRFVPGQSSGQAELRRLLLVCSREAAGLPAPLRRARLPPHGPRAGACLS